MHDQHSSGRPARSRRDDRDPQVAYDEEQAYVPDELLDEYPALMTYEEAASPASAKAVIGAKTTGFEIAVRALGWAGLIRRQGDLLVPVRPARQMAAIGFSLG